MSYGVLKAFARRVLDVNQPPHLRTVADIEGWLSLEEADLLYSLAREVKDGCIVEVGSYRGRATVALALGAIDGHRPSVYTLDPHEEFVGVLGGKFGPEDRGAFYRNMLRSSCYRIVRLINLSSDVMTPGWTQPVSLLWIDGDHSFEAVKSDFRCWEPHLADDARVVFDDAVTSDVGPARVIDEITHEGKFKKFLSVGKVVAIERILQPLEKSR